VNNAAKPTQKWWPFKPRSLERRSLFAEILDWMLVPLLVVWPLTIILTYGVAEGLSQQPFDRVLEDQVQALSRQVSWDDDISFVNLPASARNILRADDTDQIFFQIRNQKNRIISGDPDLSVPDEEEGKRLQVVQFRSEEMGNKKIRIAHMWVAPQSGDNNPTRWVLVQVAETLGKRTQLATLLKA
jgi:two-component system, OmpR family, sensor histidine kinase TctE